MDLELVSVEDLDRVSVRDEDVVSAVKVTEVPVADSVL